MFRVGLSSLRLVGSLGAKPPSIGYDQRSLNTDKRLDYGPMLLKEECLGLVFKPIGFGLMFSYLFRAFVR